MKDTDFKVRTKAVEAFAEIGEPALPTLYKAMEEGDDTVKKGAERAIRKIESR